MGWGLGNVGGGGAANTIVVYVESGAVVTATDEDGKSYTATSFDGVATIKISDTGMYTVTAEKDGLTVSEEIEVTDRFETEFRFGVPLSDLPEGALVAIPENGVPALFYIAKQNYEPALNGTGRTLIVRKDCYDLRVWHSSNVNAYASSDIDNWLNGTYKGLFDTAIQDAIGTTKFHYTPGNGISSVTTLTRAIFLLSVTELGKAASYANVEGSVLPIASTLQIAYYNGSAVSQWTRSPGANHTTAAYSLDTTGNVYYGGGCSNTNWSRPAFTLPSTVLVKHEPNADGSYSLNI